MEYKFKLSKLHCAGCALALEQNLNTLEGVKAEINFVSKQLKLFIESENPADTLTAVKIAVANFDRSIELVDFDDEEELLNKDKKQRMINVIRFSASILLAVIAVILNVKWLKVSFFAISYLISAYDVLWGAILNVKGKNINSFNWSFYSWSILRSSLCNAFVWYW